MDKNAIKNRTAKRLPGIVLTATIVLSSVLSHQGLDRRVSMPGEVLSQFIVQGGDVDTVSNLVFTVGGEVTHKLYIIKAVGARLTTAQVENLKKCEGISRIYENRCVEVMGGNRTDHEEKYDSSNGGFSLEFETEMPVDENIPEIPNYHNKMIGAELLHEEGITGDGVTIAVIDTGLYSASELLLDTG